MMPVDPADVEQLRTMLATAPESAADDLHALQTIPEVIAYVVHAARHDGDDEVKAAELLVRAADLSRDELRRAQATLRPLGYTSVASMLGKLAGRKRRVPKS